MRRVRWKKGYATGNRHLDERNKALVGIIQEIDGALRAKEHCQDMEDLQATLTDMTGERLAQGESAGYGRGSDEAIRALLHDSLPLAALDTPACRHCEVCDLTEERLDGWLSHDATLATAAHSAKSASLGARAAH